MTALQNRRVYRWSWLCALPALLLWCSPALLRAEAPKAAADPQLNTEPAQWMRFVDDHNGGGKLQVAEGTYKNDKGITVHLVGAVHVGEKQYYEGLNKEFTKFDAVLYEMVKPANMGAPKPNTPSHSMIGMFQHFLKDVLELDFQLDDIDYSKANFVHADLDAKTFAKMEQDRGESIMGLMLGQMMRQMAKSAEGGDKAQAPQPSLLDLIDAFNSPDRGRALKMILGRSFGDLEDQMSGMNGTVLVTERNKKALSVLRDEIGKGKKDLAIFYGAAHLQDMESRLALMGFKRTKLVWHTAWNMSTPDKDAQAKP